MSGFVYPNCGGKSRIFKPTTGGGKQLAKDLGVKFLGSCFLDIYPDSPASEAIMDVVDELRDAIEGDSTSSADKGD
ncbi:hypothetical protein HII12_004753 [Brettanomyces bruxellensis]|uniref:Uncharacterized protein n=1 Tax=Dekkera bruxellensis TaxID=5007 RepID=A0A8H6EQV1_DEKBR|nr:hypothetical protein HII12_004753 [Brettanomyces bruxellensis]